jgi:hypothetical protein
MSFQTPAALARVRECVNELIKTVKTQMVKAYWSTRKGEITLDLAPALAKFPDLRASIRGLCIVHLNERGYAVTPGAQENTIDIKARPGASSPEKKNKKRPLPEEEKEFDEDDKDRAPRPAKNSRRGQGSAEENKFDTGAHSSQEGHSYAL